MVLRATDTRREGEGAYASLDDRMLVLDFQAGQPEAFVEIHRRYSGLAHHICRRFLSDQRDADEAVQETMIRVFQGLYRFNGRYALQPWVARIATNVSLDVLRGRARRPQLDEHSLDEYEREDGGETPEEAVERLVQRDLVLSVLSDLPDAHRKALVLRELEGHSHREIAEVLGITPPQAKALIHRAKRSFRRRWLETVAERSGLAAFAFAPLLWLLKLAGSTRRFADRVGQVAIATDAATSGAASTLAPATTVTAGERVVAAAVTLLVAGGVGVGAVAMSHRDRAPREVFAVPAPAVARPSPSATAHEVTDDREVRRARERQEQVGPVQPAVETTPSPVGSATPTPEPSETPTPGPSVEPTPEPTETPPPIPPPPAWSGSFGVDWTSRDDCGCGPGIELVSSRATGSVEQGLEFSQSLSGAALDAEQDAAWALRADFSGYIKDKDGRLSLAFELTNDVGAYGYSGTTGSAERWDGEGGTTVYIFTGAYSLAQVPDDQGPIPPEGTFRVSVWVWPDGETLTQLVTQLQP